MRYRPATPREISMGVRMGNVRWLTWKCGTNIVLIERFSAAPFPLFSLHSLCTVNLYNLTVIETREVQARGGSPGSRRKRTGIVDTDPR